MLWKCRTNSTRLIHTGGDFAGFPASRRIFVEWTQWSGGVRSNDSDRARNAFQQREICCELTQNGSRMQNDSHQQCRSPDNEQETTVIGFSSGGKYR
jgi:hypothetical protein